MDAISQNKRYNIVKQIHKIIEKLFSMHDKKKLTTSEFKEKLTALKTRIHNDFLTISQTVSKPSDDLNTLIAEHLIYNNYQSAYDLFTKKHKVIVNTKYYKDLSTITADIQNKKYEKLQDYITQNRMILKSIDFEYKNQKLSFGDFEKIFKIFCFYEMCKENKKNEAIAYIKEEFKKNREAINTHLRYIVNENIELNDCYDVENSHDFAELFKMMYLSLYRQCSVSRLEKRLEYGVMCYKTKVCGKSNNPNCPTCLGLLSEMIKVIPGSRKDNSIILCKGSGKEMNEQNQAYCFESGYVYCEDYIAKINYHYECVVTGEVCKDNPKKCYFV
ncbi:GID complex subunit containing RING finger motif [Binucleata daphniae]